MPQIDISTDSLTRQKDYQGASLEQAWTDCSASTRSTSPSQPWPSSRERISERVPDRSTDCRRDDGVLPQVHRPRVVSKPSSAWS